MAKCKKITEDYIMYERDTKVQAPDGSIGVVRASQEETNYQARGYFVKFDDFPIAIFMPEKLIKPVIELKESANGQLMMNV